MQFILRMDSQRRIRKVKSLLSQIDGEHQPSLNLCGVDFHRQFLLIS